MVDSPNLARGLDARNEGDQDSRDFWLWWVAATSFSVVLGAALSAMIEVVITQAWYRVEMPQPEELLKSILGVGVAISVFGSFRRNDSMDGPAVAVEPRWLVGTGNHRRMEPGRSGWTRPVGRIPGPRARLCNGCVAHQRAPPSGWVALAWSGVWMIRFTFPLATFAPPYVHQAALLLFGVLLLLGGGRPRPVTTSS